MQQPLATQGPLSVIAPRFLDALSDAPDNARPRVLIFCVFARRAARYKWNDKTSINNND
jgi:hypothetical protein